MSGVISVNRWGLSDLCGSESACRIVFAAVALFHRYDLQEKS